LYIEARSCIWQHFFLFITRNAITGYHQERISQGFKKPSCNRNKITASDERPLLRLYRAQKNLTLDKSRSSAASCQMLPKNSKLRYQKELEMKTSE
jgi:hypothetical protein